MGLVVVIILSVTACKGQECAPAAAGGESPRPLTVTIVGEARDPRLAPVREALHHWNNEAARLGLCLRLDSGTVRNGAIPSDALRATSRAMPWGGLGLVRLRGALADVPGDVVIVLAKADLVSFGATFGTGRVGVIGLRPSDRWPLSLPNTVRNVVAHELGHVLGLEHNADATTLMCGRPAPCRPADFASRSPHFFPLSPADEERLRRRWR